MKSPKINRLEWDAPGKKRLVKSAMVVSLWTLCSRVLGMVRDVVSARQFGTSWQWDAFVYAFMLPNFFRRLVGEGALSGAFIPVYGETLQKHSKEEAFRFANVVFTVWAVGLLTFTLLVEGLVAVLLRLDLFNARLTLTLQLSQVLFPYLLIISLFSIGMGVLHSHRHFFAPSLAPVVLNIFWIAGVLWIAPSMAERPVGQLRMLAYCVVASGVIQFLIQMPYLRRLGFRFRWSLDFAYAGLQKTFRLLIPALLGFAVMQINIMVDMTLAFMIGPGANSSLWYGTRLMQLPLGVFAIAVGTALLPMLSQQIANHQFEEADQTLSFSLRNVFFIVLPCSVGLMVLSAPIIRMLFERGEFDSVSTARTAGVLFCYTLGLFAHSGQKLFVSGFHAGQDTRTPVKIGVLALIANVFFNFLFMVPLKEAGLALATSFSGIIHFGLLAALYRKRISEFSFQEVTRSFLKILAVSAAMGFFVWFLAGWMRLEEAGSSVALMVKMAGIMAAAGIFYFTVCFVFKVREMREVWDWWVKKRRRLKNA